MVNFNLHGDMVPRSVSVVFTPLLGKQRKIETCLMPHGGRITHDGRFHYSACMMSDQLVEIATGRNEVSRRLSLAPGHEGVVTGDPQGHMTMGPPGCKPTWVAISPDDRLLYAPCSALTPTVTRTRKGALANPSDPLRLTTQLDSPSAA